MPLPFVEVDNCRETAEEIADSLEKYARFLQGETKGRFVGGPSRYFRTGHWSEVAARGVTVK
ncbi:hypothetical protein ABVG11_00380 [Streptomyces sp. HD1123-B1]|uniref:hypothetical protein n=1 Tax=Streptomyces huangiella TaxID=3228804 RepID=UPI003D7D46BC